MAGDKEIAVGYIEYLLTVPMRDLTLLDYLIIAPAMAGAFLFAVWLSSVYRRGR
jgi:hypothetical protein